MPGQIESQFSALSPEKEGKAQKSVPETSAKPAEMEKPIQETHEAVSYLGVELKKAKDVSGNFVPKRQEYGDYINDEFSLNLQKKIAVSFLAGEPILIEGGTSIGKTTTVRKMCSELGWEVHYANLNGATDVEDLMGRYIPNPHKTKPEDPEYIFADGKVTSGLRQQKDKTKVIILDEFNSAAPNILIRLHEVLDALERNGDVVLSEDASETVAVNKGKTKVIALMNPPGKGYFGREPLDPAQLRRWVYQKEVTDLPESTFSHSTEALFNLAPKTKEVAKESFLYSRQDMLAAEQLAEIPGISEICKKYEEFHKAAKQMLKERTLAADQPQLFTYDDRMEPRRIRDFVLKFYNGDINETFQNALRYYYINKIESQEDRAKLEELMKHVTYIAQAESKRKPLDEEAKPENTLKNQAEKELAGLMASEKIPDVIKDALSGAETKLSPDILEQIKEAKSIFGQDFIGPDEIQSALEIDGEIEVPSIPFSIEELKRAKELGQFLILRTDKIPAEKLALSAAKRTLENPPEKKWALVSKEIIPESTNKNYLQQTGLLANYLKEQVLKDKKIPEQYQQAIKQFNSQKKEIAALMDSDWQKAAEMLANLELNKLTRQTKDEVFYDLEVYYQINEKSLLPDKWTWTSSRDSDGGLVGVGSFDSDGVGVHSGRPGNSPVFLGVSFSRSF